MSGIAEIDALENDFADNPNIPEGSLVRIRMMLIDAAGFEPYVLRYIVKDENGTGHEKITMFQPGPFNEQIPRIDTDNLRTQPKYPRFMFFARPLDCLQPWAEVCTFGRRLPPIPKPPPIWVIKLYKNFRRIKCRQMFEAIGLYFRKPAKNPTRCICNICYHVDKYPSLHVVSMYPILSSELFPKRILHPVPDPYNLLKVFLREAFRCEAAGDLLLYSMVNQVYNHDAMPALCGTVPVFFDVKRIKPIVDLCKLFLPLVKVVKVTENSFTKGFIMPHKVVGSYELHNPEMMLPDGCMLIFDFTGMDLPATVAGLDRVAQNQSLLKRYIKERTITWVNGNQRAMMRFDASIIVICDRINGSFLDDDDLFVKCPVSTGPKDLPYLRTVLRKLPRGRESLNALRKFIGDTRELVKDVKLSKELETTFSRTISAKYTPLFGIVDLPSALQRQVMMEARLQCALQREPEVTLAHLEHALDLFCTHLTRIRDYEPSVPTTCMPGPSSPCAGCEPIPVGQPFDPNLWFAINSHHGVTLNQRTLECWHTQQEDGTWNLLLSHEFQGAMSNLQEWITRESARPELVEEDESDHELDHRDLDEGEEDETFEEEVLLDSGSSSPVFPMTYQKEQKLTYDKAHHDLYQGMLGLAEMTGAPMPNPSRHPLPQRLACYLTSRLSPTSLQRSLAQLRVAESNPQPAPANDRVPDLAVHRDIISPQPGPSNQPSPSRANATPAQPQRRSRLDILRQRNRRNKK